MKNKPIVNGVLIIAISICFLLIGHNFVLQRTLSGPTRYLTIRNDALHYASMVEGHWENALSPFRFRVLVPFVASLMPFAPLESLKVISYVSLFMTYIVIMLICSKLGINILHSAVGLMAVWASTWHFYNYHNPFLTDAFALLCLCVMLLAVVIDSYSIFFTASVFGVLSRETIIILIPVWFVKKEIRQSIIVLVVAIVVLSIPRIMLASETDQTLVTAFYTVNILHQPITFIKEIFKSWGFIWFLSLIGIWYIPREKFTSIATAYVLLLTGAIISSLVATDTGRMFSILTPILAITLAELSGVIFEKKRYMFYILLSLVFLQVFISSPNRIFPEGSEVFILPRYILLGVEIIYSLAVFIILRKSLYREMRDKGIYLFENKLYPKVQIP